MTEAFRMDNQVLRGLHRTGLWMAAADTPLMDAAGHRIDVVATGMHAGSRHNDRQALFTPAAVEAAIRALDGRSLPGRNGHTYDGSFGISVVYWTRVEMGSETPHPDGGTARPVYFYGHFRDNDPQVSDDVRKEINELRSAYDAGITLYNSVSVRIPPDGIDWEELDPDDDCEFPICVPTINAFSLHAMDFVLTPSDLHARSILTASASHSFVSLPDGLSWDPPESFAANRPTPPSGSSAMTPPKTQSADTPAETTAAATPGPDPAAWQAVQDAQAAADTRLAAVETELEASRRRNADADALNAVLGQIEELPPTLRYEADRAVRAKFAALRADRNSDSPATLAELAASQALVPFRKQAAEAILAAQAEAAADDTGDADTGSTELIQSGGPTAFEAATGRSHFELPITEMLKLWETNRHVPGKFRQRSGHHRLPSEFDYSQAGQEGLWHWDGVRQMRQEMINAPIFEGRPQGPRYRDALREEVKQWEEHAADKTGPAAHRAWLTALTAKHREMGENSFWQFASTSDYVTPVSALMAPVDAIFPMIPTGALMDMGTSDITDYTVTIEDRRPVQSESFTVTAPGALAAGQHYDLSVAGTGYRHIDPDSTFTIAGLTEDDDYAVDWVRGHIHNVKSPAASINLGNIAGKYFPYSLGEGKTPAESKTITTPAKETLWVDRIKIKYTYEASVVPLADSGYDVTTRLNYAGMFDLQEMIAHAWAHMAWFGLRWMANSNIHYLGSSKTTVDIDAYKAFGAMCATRKDEGFGPTIGLMNHRTADLFTNLDRFDEDGSPAARLDEANNIVRLKGMPIMPMRFWPQPANTFPRIALAAPPLCRYRILAQNGIRSTVPAQQTDGDGEIVDGMQYIIRIFHFIGNFYKNENNAVLLPGTG